MKRTNNNGYAKMNEGYKKVAVNFTNRSSALFPLYIRPETDVRIVFFNYWKIKNHLSGSIVNFWIYNEMGEKITIESFKITESHNDFSIKELINCQHFDGMVNVEIINTKNLTFPFPGIMAFYQAGDKLSGVHSAGRIKNAEEPKIISEMVETNWSCKWQQGMTPFFHAFNGNLHGFVENIVVKILSPTGDILMEKCFDPCLKNAFSSKIFLLDELFDYDPQTIPDNSYVEVTLPSSDVFPRMIVGNFHKDIEFLEVTHSYAKQYNEDYLNSSETKEKPPVIPSINPIVTNNDLSLNLTFFPTNCPGIARGSWRRAKPSERLKDSSEEFEINCGGSGSKVITYKIQPGDMIAALDIYHGKIPTRINTNYVYEVACANSPFSTDIAAGQIAKYFPSKLTTWGHGIMGKGYKTVLFLTAFAHDNDNRIESIGKLTIFRKNGLCYSKEFTIGEDSGILIDINDVIGEHIEELEVISWYYLQQCRTKLVAYWVSYAMDGRITGDHAF